MKAFQSNKSASLKRYPNKMQRNLMQKIELIS